MDIKTKWKTNWKKGFKPYAEVIEAVYKQCMEKSSLDRMACIAEAIHKKKVELAASKEAILAKIDKLA